MQTSVARLLVLLVVSCVSASAQVAEVTAAWKRSTFSDGKLGQVGLIPREFSLQDGSGFNLLFSINGRSLFGHELSYGYESDPLRLGDSEQGSVQAHKFSYDFVVHATKPGARVRPFALAGAGFARFIPPGEAAIQARNLTKFGGNFGGGLKLRLHRHFGLRLEVRDIVAGKPNFFDLNGVDGTVHNVEYSVGFSWLP
jgi:hypothetical protein